MYSTFESDDIGRVSGPRRLARRDVRPRTTAVVTVPTGKVVWPELTVGAALSWVRRGLLLIILVSIAASALAFGYSVWAKPKYTAMTDLIIDPANLQVVNDDLYANSLQSDAQVMDVESKLRILTSGNVLRRVVDQLNLTQDPEFAPPASSFGDTGVTRNPVDAAVDTLSKKVAAWREERSYAVTVSASTEDPNKSVKIADAVVAAFQAELAQAEAAGATRAADALMSRLGDLKNDVTTAENAVEAFKREHNLQGLGTDGQYVSTQSLTQVNTQAVDAQQALIQAESRYRELTDPKTGAANVDAVQTDTIVALRTQLGLLRQQVDSSTTLYGPLHPARASAERQLKGLQAQIAAEARRAVQAAKLDLDQARRNVAQLATQNTEARSTVASDDQADVQLRELDRDAKAKAAVYEAFLTRAREVTERQQLDTTNIRVISPAVPPSVRSWPPRGVVMAGGGFAGGAVLGIILALGLGFLADSRRQPKI